VLLCLIYLVIQVGALTLLVGRQEGHLPCRNSSNSSKNVTDWLNKNWKHLVIQETVFELSGFFFDWLVLFQETCKYLARSFLAHCWQFCGDRRSAPTSAVCNGCRQVSHCDILLRSYNACCVLLAVAVYLHVWCPSSWWWGADVNYK